jgi:hypothetical protein
MPHFRHLAKQLPGWRLGVLNLERPDVNLDFPVEYTPTLHLAIRGRRFTTNPAQLQRGFTAANMRLWLDAVEAKLAREGA